MKKITIYIVMALLCLNFWTRAQNNKAVDVTLKGIQIGQKMPDITITNLHNYKDANGKPATTAKLSDFKGKLLILDFWATWCSPCVAMIPKMDSLQKAFGNKIQFLSVTYQTKKEVMPFLSNLEKVRRQEHRLPLLVGDTLLRRLFPHKTLPHYVMIGQDGKVMAITGMDAINKNQLMAMIEGKYSDVYHKADIFLAYDYKRPFFTDTVMARRISLQSTITGANEQLRLTHSFDADKDGKLGYRRITISNFSIGRLFQVAMGRGRRTFNWERTLLQVADTSKVNSSLTGKAYMDWLKAGNGFCYEIIVADKKADPYFLMEQDLRKYFSNYVVSLEKKPMDVLVLKRTSKEDMLSTKGGPQETNITEVGALLRNSTLWALNGYVGYYLKKVVDETGYTDKVDIDIKADMRSIDQINRALSAYGLQYVSEVRDFEYLVIKDNPNYHPIIGKEGR